MLKLLRPVRSFVALAGVLGTFLLVPGDAFAQPESPGYQVERVERFVSVAAGQVLSVTNPFGDVSARFGGYEGAVEARAVIQQFEAEGPRLVMVIGDTSRGPVVRVGTLGADGKTLDLEPVKGQKKRADLVIFVPQGARLEVTTLEGRVEARGLKSDLRVRTRAGGVSVRSVQGNLDLASEAGSILATPELEARTEVQRFTTGQGDISLILPQDGAFTVSASTTGWLSTDFSLAIERDPADVTRRRGRGKNGAGRTQLEVTSQSGHLRLQVRPGVPAGSQPP
jgi:Putative adhesin